MLNDNPVIYLNILYFCFAYPEIYISDTQVLIKIISMRFF